MALDPITLKNSLSTFVKKATYLRSSKIIEERFKVADFQNEKINKEKQNWLTGKLVDPELVTGWIIEEIKKHASKGDSLVFSASPRTVYEAERQMPLHVELYGKENIKIKN